MDNRPPPPGAPPSYPIVSQVYRRNLRPIVIAFSVISGIWAFFSAIGFFRNAGVDRAQNVPKLVTFDIALGALATVVAVIEGFGAVSAVSQRLALVRIYAFLSVLTALIVVASGIISTVAHFTLKNDLISECAKLTNGSTIYFGFWGPTSHETVDANEASQWCQEAWDHDSSSEIISLLITTTLAVMFSSMVFAYYRQLLDPTSPANAARAPSYQVRHEGYPAHYNPPYNASVPNLGYNAPHPTYAPPPGPPPRDAAFAPPYDGKPPGYGAGEGRSMGDDFKDKEDPFADFDGPNEGDAASRAAAAGRQAFR